MNQHFQVITLEHGIFPLFDRNDNDGLEIAFYSRYHDRS